MRQFQILGLVVIFCLLAVISLCNGQNNTTVAEAMPKPVSVTIVERPKRDGYSSREREERERRERDRRERERERERRERKERLCRDDCAAKFRHSFDARRACERRC